MNVTTRNADQPRGAGRQLRYCDRVIGHVIFQMVKNSWQTSEYHKGQSFS